jgi:hypothetical protein
MGQPKTKSENPIKTRTPQKKTVGGIFANLRSLPHPVEEILGLSESDSVVNYSTEPLSDQIHTLSDFDTVTLNDRASEFDTVRQSDTVISKHFDTSLTQAQSLTEHDEDTTLEIDTISKSTLVHNSTQYRSDTVSKLDTVSDSNTVSSFEPTPSILTGFLEVPHNISDELAPSLKPSEWAVYFQLYRLSHGWGRSDCIIGYKRLIERTNIKKTALRETLDSLIHQGLIDEVEVLNTKQIKGTRYRVHIGRNTGTISDSDTVSKNNTVSKTEPNKDDHDLSKKDHHQARSVEGNKIDEMKQETMIMYERLTGKKFNNTDELQYQKIRHLSISEILNLMQIVHQRAAQPIGSFAYFAKGILSEKESLGKGIDSVAKMRTRYEKIVREIRSSYIGGNLQISDLVFKVKTRVINEGMTWNDDVINEILGI